MINPEELRIGNFVRKKGYHIIFGPVMFITRTDVGIEMYEDDDYLSIQDVESIPLTEEWLLKFGFEYDEWMSADGKSKGVDFFKSSTSTRVSISDDVCKKGVHWFQNWYYFDTGEELTLKHE